MRPNCLTYCACERKVGRTEQAADRSEGNTVSNTSENDGDYPAGVPSEDEPERFIERSLQSDELEEEGDSAPLSPDDNDDDADASDRDPDAVDIEVNDG
jgi:hypothetical protein